MGGAREPAAGPCALGFSEWQRNDKSGLKPTLSLCLKKGSPLRGTGGHTQHPGKADTWEDRQLGR